jgi:hypothetical protein
MAVDGVGAVLGCMVGEIGVHMDITLLIPDIGNNVQVEPGAHKLPVAIHLLANKAIHLKNNYLKSKFLS